MRPHAYAPAHTPAEAYFALERGGRTTLLGPRLPLIQPHLRDVRGCLAPMRARSACMHCTAHACAAERAYMRGAGASHIAHCAVAAAGTAGSQPW